MGTDDPVRIDEQDGDSRLARGRSSRSKRAGSTRRRTSGTAAVAAIELMRKFRLFMR